jgi:hypothetical protein
MPGYLMQLVKKRREKQFQLQRVSSAMPQILRRQMCAGRFSNSRGHSVLRLPGLPLLSQFVRQYKVRRSSRKFAPGMTVTSNIALPRSIGSTVVPRIIFLFLQTTHVICERPSAL